MPGVGWPSRDARELPQPTHLLLHPAGDPAGHRRGGGRHPDRARFGEREDRGLAESGASRGGGAVHRCAASARWRSRKPSRPTTGSPRRSATATAPRSRTGSRPSPSGPARSACASRSTARSRSRRARARRSRPCAAGWSTRTARPPGNGPLGTRPDEFANLLERVTGFDVVLTQEASWCPAPSRASRVISRWTGTSTHGREYRVTGFQTEAFDSETPCASVSSPPTATPDAVSDNTLGILLILVAFLLCALAFALTAARSLQAQTQRRSTPRNSSGAGDFCVQVPTEGNDEFALLGKEFNSMARQLEARAWRSSTWSARAAGDRPARRRVDRQGPGPRRPARHRGPDGGRRRRRGVGPRLMRDGPEGSPAEAARAGDVSAYLQRLQATEEAALEDREPAEMEFSGANALARPMYAPDGVFDVLGVISSRGPAGRSRRASRSCSPTSRTRQRSRSRTSTCTRRSSARRSPTSSPGCSTTAASRRS